MSIRKNSAQVDGEWVYDANRPSYDLRVDGGNVIFTERAEDETHHGTLVKSGEWYEGELQKNGVNYGYIRLKRTTEGVRSQ